MNEVNNFASVTFGHCGKFEHFALDLGISRGAAPLGIIPWFQSKILNFPQCPQNNCRALFLGSKAKCLNFPQCLQDNCRAVINLQLKPDLFSTAQVSVSHGWFFNFFIVQMHALTFCNKILYAINQVDENLNLEHTPDLEEMEKVNIHSYYKETMHQCYYVGFDVRRQIYIIFS